jgi:hypothetical protein
MREKGHYIMKANLFRRLVWFVPAAGVALIALPNCGAINQAAGAAGVPGVPGQCSLDVKNVDAIEKFDFAGQFKLQADAAAKLKAGTVAAVELEAFSAKIDGMLLEACGGLVKDLGGSGDFKTGTDACNAAADVVAKARAALGAHASVTIQGEPPKCGADVTVEGDCAAHCDATVQPGSVQASCTGGEMQGECDANCTGSCDMEAAATCSGTCSGSCTANFSGSCGGKCDGKCDGHTSSGASCSGKCEGKCDAQASGTCGGSCTGSCKMDAGASCKGTCTGKCSAEFKAPRCTGSATPPNLSADCKAKCDARANASFQCTKAHLSVVVTGAADEAAALKFQNAIAANFGNILVVFKQMGENAVGMAGSIKDVALGAKDAVMATVQAGGASGATMAANIAGCVGGAFTGVADAAASVKANVSVSASVSAKAGVGG